MANKTKNKIRTVHYLALNLVNNISDFNVIIKKPNGHSFHPSPNVQNLGDGLYSFSYMPNMAGIWIEKISSNSNGDNALQSIIIENYDLDDIYQNLNPQHGGHFHC